jgi:hypothetical protein
MIGSVREVVLLDFGNCRPYTQEGVFMSIDLTRLQVVTHAISVVQNAYLDLHLSDAHPLRSLIGMLGM